MPLVRKTIKTVPIAPGWEGGGGAAVRPPPLDFTLAASAAIAWDETKLTGGTPAPLAKKSSVLSEALMFGDGGDTEGPRLPPIAGAAAIF